MAERKRRLDGRSAEGFLTGMLNKKLALALLKLSGIAAAEPVEAVDQKRFQRLIQVIKQYETVVIATNPYENAQICCGGVDTRQIEPATMESKLIKGLYFAGEIVDVDGICGGYNLQWPGPAGTWQEEAAQHSIAKRRKRKETDNQI